MFHIFKSLYECSFIKVLKYCNKKSSGNNYYIITINGKDYKFAINNKENLKIPKYIASDIMSKIMISSSDSSVPLDVAITVKL